MTEIITAQEVRELVVTDVSFDPIYFEKYILLAQTKYIKPALGKDFYNDYVANFGALPVEYQTLKDNFIDKALAFYVVYEAFTEIRDKLTNQGVMHNRSEFTEQTPSFDFGALKSTYNYNGNFWIAEMIEYIIDNQTDYPLFSNGCGESDFNSNNKGFIFYD